jgi:hypothetical protein
LEAGDCGAVGVKAAAMAVTRLIHAPFGCTNDDIDNDGICDNPLTFHTSTSKRVILLSDRDYGGSGCDDMVEHVLCTVPQICHSLLTSAACMLLSLRDYHLRSSPLPAPAFTIPCTIPDNSLAQFPSTDHVSIPILQHVIATLLNALAAAADWSSISLPYWPTAMCGVADRHRPRSIIRYLLLL